MRKTQRTVGVVKGRFQTYEPHAGHDYTVHYAMARHETVLIIVGTRYNSTTHDPLPFPLIKMMLEGRYPGVMVVEEKTSRASYAKRSEDLTELITKVCPGCEAVIYGARDSIVHTYRGPFKVVEVPTLPQKLSATQMRENIPYRNSVDFRKGYMRAANDRPPIPYPAVDVAVLDHSGCKVLLIGLADEQPKLRFPGVFFDMKLGDRSYEDAAVRCVDKELPGVSAHSPVAVTSVIVPDRRYRQTKDGVITQIIRLTYEKGVARTTAGITEARWVEWNKVGYVIAPDHKPIYQALKKRFWQ